MLPYPLFLLLHSSQSLSTPKNNIQFRGIEPPRLNCTGPFFEPAIAVACNSFAQTLRSSLIHATRTDRWCLLYIFQHDLPTMDASEWNISLRHSLILAIAIKPTQHIRPIRRWQLYVHTLCVFNNDVKAKGFSKINLKLMLLRNTQLRDDKCFRRLNACIIGAWSTVHKRYMVYLNIMYVFMKYQIWMGSVRPSHRYALCVNIMCVKLYGLRIYNIY